MIRNPTFLMNVQVAFLGILVVIGLFYIWRYLSRIEEKLDVVQRQMVTQPIAAPTQPMMAAPQPMFDEAAMADEFMKDVFSAPIFLNSFAMKEPQGVKVEEVPQTETQEEPVAPPNVEEDTKSVTTTSTTLSKTKVKRMTVDALRETCKERGLSTEGTRPELLDRVLNTLEDE
jgi:SAP domain